MCGRSACTLDPQAIKDNLNIKQWDKQDRYHQSYNVAPTRYQPVIMYDNGKLLKSMKWGYMGNNPQLSTINARSEGITSSPMWSKLLPTNRCAVVASGYFEWQTTGGKKQPHFLHFKDRPLIVMAGLYEEQLEENANAKDIGWLHDRMPVVLDTDEKIDLWIRGDYETQKDEILSVLKPYEGLECYAVPELVNSNRNDTADCIRKYEDFKKTGGIAAFFQAPKKETKNDVDKLQTTRREKDEKNEEKKKKKPVGIEAFFEPKKEDKNEKEAEDVKEEVEKQEEDEDNNNINKKEEKKEEHAKKEEAKVEEEATKEEIKKELKEELKAEIVEELKKEIKDEMTEEVKAEIKEAHKESKEQADEGGSVEPEKKGGTKRKKPATGDTKEGGSKKEKSRKK